MDEKTSEEKEAIYTTGGHRGAGGDHALPYEFARKLIAISLIAGIIGGVGGEYLINRYSPSSTLSNTQKQQVVLQETSAVTNVVKKVSPSVVSITGDSTVTDFFGQSAASQTAGSGIILTANGLIMTNKHVVSDATATYTVFTSDGKEYKNAKVIATDPTNDVAFVQISATGLTPAVIGDSSGVVVGQQVVAIGNALGQYQNTATEGIVSGLGRPVQAGSQDSTSTESLSGLIQTDAAINPGNSGGPLVNLEGQVIGMNTAVAGNAQNIGFSIPTNELTSEIKSIESQGKIIKPYLGVRYIEITPDYATANNLKVSDGAYVTGDSSNPAIVTGSPADKAGLLQGDILTKVNSDAITTSNTLSALIGKYNVGDKVTITYIRGGKTQTALVTLAQAQ
jgi:serine protease Do